MTGSPLTLLEQIDHTDGLCGPFAVAAQALIGGSIRLLYCADPRQFRAHGWPASVPLCLHAFVDLGDGTVVDAEGRRPLSEMLRAFGVKPSYRYRIADDPDGSLVRSEFPLACKPDRVHKVTEMLDHHGWAAGVPMATGELARRWKEARALQRRRA